MWVGAFDAWARELMYVCVEKAYGTTLSRVTMNNTHTGECDNEEIMTGHKKGANENSWDALQVYVYTQLRRARQRDVYRITRRAITCCFCLSVQTLRCFRITCLFRVNGFSVN